MMLARVTLFLLVGFLVTPPRHAPMLSISVTADPASASAPLRVIASSGTVVASGRSYRAAGDTLRVIGAAELTTQDPIFVATFIADAPGGRVRASVRENGIETLQGRGDVVVIMRTPQGAQLQAMPVPPELRRTP
jgi:hypothetical protein